MCFVCCDVRIKSSWLSGSGVSGRPGIQRSTTIRSSRWPRVRRDIGTIPTMPQGIVDCSPVHTTYGHSPEGVRSLGTDNRNTEGGCRPEGPTLPSTETWLLRNGTADMAPRERPRGSPDEAGSRRNLGGATSRPSHIEKRRTRIWTGGEEFTDATSQCPNPGSEGGSRYSPGPGRHWPEISTLPRLVRIGLNSVERLGSSTPHGYSTQARQLSRWAVEDGVCIHLPERCSLGTDFTTCLGGWNNKAGGTSSFYSTPGSSFWGCWQGGYSGTENLQHWANGPWVLLVLWWVPGYCRRSRLEFICP